MNKLILLLIVVLGSSSATISQEKYSFFEKLEWYSKKISTRTSYNELSSPTFANASFDLITKQPVRYVKKIKLPGFGNISASLKILSQEEIPNNSVIELNNLDAQPIVISDVVNEENQYFAFVSFVPLIKNGNTISKINTFDLTISFSPRERNSFRGPNFKSTSVLSESDVYDIIINESGLNKLSYNYLLNELNIPASQINSDKLKLYGNRGGLLPEALNIDRYDDLEEIPYLLVGGDDGSFDQSDYIIFYGEGADTYKIKEDKKEFEKNIYDSGNHYYLKYNEQQRLKISNVNGNYQSNNVFDSYHRYQRIEDDKTNLLGAFGSTQGSGKDWYGDYFNITTERNYSDQFDFSGILDNSILDVKVLFAGRSGQSHTVFLSVAGSEMSQSIRSVNVGNIEARYAQIVSINSSQLVTQSDINDISIRFPTTGSNEGWLDYIETLSEHSLILNSGSLSFVNINSKELAESTYTVEGASGAVIWDITDPINITNISSESAGNNLIFSANNNFSLKEYTVFNPSEIEKEPTPIGKLSNQNLHGIDNAEFIIVYHNEFKSAAERLADYRNNTGLKTIIVDIDEIYREFASGKKDPVSIRDFNRMIYDRSENYKFLLLMGDASYDYKNIVNGLPDQNFVPTYETNESLHPIEAFPSDDFFGLLSDFEGDDLKGQLEIAVGRIPVKTKEEAEIVVDKIIRYETSTEALGDWRLRIGFTADDEDSNTHLNQAERISKNTASKFSLFNQEKIYFDAFVQESTPGDTRYPGASTALNNNIFKGQLVLNYLGHGGPKGWAQERVLKVNDILRWNNFYKMPLLITATCSFTGYDDPALISAGEYSILSEKGGAIGLMTTVRAVYSSENERLTASVFDTIFSRDGDLDISIGDIIKRAKNNNWQDTARINARKFALIGDPALKLAIPQHEVITTSINNTPINSQLDTLSALEKVKISGFIANRQGNKINDFNGLVFPTVYDKQSTIETLGNDPRSRQTKFNIYKSVLFKGSVSVINGDFTFEFIIPKDIDYTIGQGRISYYASGVGLEDAGGQFSSFLIGGSDTSGIIDNEGPQIEMYMNDNNFVYGGNTNSSPTLLVNLNDNNGINVTGNGIGHDLVAVLDGDEKNSLLLNDFYESNVDDYTSGTVRFPLSDLSTGTHTIKIKAWDIANNSNESILEFNVIDENNQGITNVYNYPNPFSTSTQFMFEHDINSNNLNVLIYIYSLSGKLIKTIREQITSSGLRVSDIFWDGRDDFGDKLAKGIYLYKIKLGDDQLSITRESDFQKMVIIN